MLQVQSMEVYILQSKQPVGGACVSGLVLLGLCSNGFSSCTTVQAEATCLQAADSQNELPNSFVGNTAADDYILHPKSYKQQAAGCWGFTGRQQAAGF